MRTGLACRAGARPRRAARYARSPSTRTALYWGGTCICSPRIDASAASSASATQRLFDPDKAFEQRAKLGHRDHVGAVRRGVVTLRGEVTDLQVLERAVNAAAAVDGTRRVVSKLEVELPAG